MLNRQPALRIPLAATLLFVTFSLLYLRDIPALRASFWGFGAGLLVFLYWLYGASTRDRRRLEFEFTPLKHHWIQGAVQILLYAYWGWYWRDVYDHVPLILAQVVFAYAFDSMLCWSRRDKWVLGFGPFPIILSTNLFIWFRDEWFYLQFLMIAVGFMGKEFVRWNREGQSRHIFNPSAFSLSVFSLALILTGTTDMTWGVEISLTQQTPPDIYPVLFLLGLVVMFFFSTTLVTATAAVTLLGFGVVYNIYTGVYFFTDSDIPSAVFLGLILLVTDPSTSPRSKFGKAVFGLMYGLGVLGLYVVLGWAGIPTFYDKLLMVPVLNLSVRVIDRLASATVDGLHLGRIGQLNPVRLNLVYMSLWIAFFGGMFSMGQLGITHEGHYIPFWQNACEQDLRHGCRTLAAIQTAQCGAGSGWACNELGILDLSGVIGFNRRGALQSFAQSCILNYEAGCENYSALRSGGEKRIHSNPKISDYLLLLQDGHGPLPNMGALELFTRACDQGWVVGCGEKARVYLTGTGVPIDYRLAAEGFDLACGMGDPTSCTDLGLMYERGDGVDMDAARASELMNRACGFGMDEACAWLEEQSPMLEEQDPTLEERSPADMSGTPAPPAGSGP